MVRMESQRKTPTALLRGRRFLMRLGGSLAAGIMTYMETNLIKGTILPKGERYIGWKFDDNRICK